MKPRTTRKTTIRITARWLCRVALGFILAEGRTCPAATPATLYPAPKGAELSQDYVVTVEGRPVDVYRGVVREDYTRSYGGPFSFAYFDLADRAEVKVTSLKKPLDHVVILPESRGIRRQVSGDTLTFTLDKPCQLSIEPDSKNGPLLLFANPPEKDAPKPEDVRYKYFGPGLHDVGAIQLKDNDRLYIAGGAVVNGGIAASGTNISISGRGILAVLSGVTGIAAAAEIAASPGVPAAPPGAAALGFTKLVIHERPTAADIAPGSQGNYAWFSGQWWYSPKPPVSHYSTRDGVLALSLGGDLVSAPHDFSKGKLPLLPGRDGFYVEFDYWLSDTDPDHFPAVWLMPAEHNGARLDRYPGDAAGYERWMELDIDEGGFGPGLTGTVHSHYGIYEQGYQQIQNPNNVSTTVLDRSQKHTFGASYDPKGKSVTWWVDGVKQMSAGSPHVPDVGARQNFYVIIGAQSHGKQKPYSMFVSGVRAYVPPNSLLPALKK